MIVTILLFIVILGILVFVHEFGHFIVAKRTGMTVEEFGFGFPPRILGIQRLTGKKLQKISTEEELNVSVTDYRLGNGTEIIKEQMTDTVKEVDQEVPTKRWRFIWGKSHPSHAKNMQAGTVYSLNWIPFGGFVKIKGEQGDNRNEKDSFAHKKIWQRAMTLAAGVSMNFILAFLLLSVGFMAGLPTALDQQLPHQAIVTSQGVQIVQIKDNSPAAQAGLQAGDYILSLDGKAVKSITDFRTLTQQKNGQKISLLIKEGTSEKQVELTPADIPGEGQGLIGAYLAETGTVRYPWYYALWMGAQTTVSITWQIVVALFTLLKNLIISHQVSADITGPIGIAVLTGQVARLGFIYIIQFMALLSINLAIINFLPFPALDGGRILFLIIEKIKGRPVNQRVENFIHNMGFLILLILIILVTFRDVSKFSANIKGFLSHLF